MTIKYVLFSIIHALNEILILFFMKLNFLFYNLINLGLTYRIHSTNYYEGCIELDQGIRCLVLCRWPRQHLGDDIRGACDVVQNINFPQRILCEWWPLY